MAHRTISNDTLSHKKPSESSKVDDADTSPSPALTENPAILSSQSKEETKSH